ncbi:MAG: hypothetical protein HKM00_00200 [Gallionella sp.]|nr:hypothetical protein [Gallionella sp.]
MVIITVNKYQVVDRRCLYTAISRAKMNAVFVRDAALQQQAADLENVVHKLQVVINFEDSHAH